ncbi:MAG: ABC transporter permease [Candidatus Thorarchaeota archaeon]
MNYLVKILEKIKFHFNMIFLNRRNTIVMFLGLGISLALISQSLMFMYGFQYGSFTGFYKEIPPRQLTISLDAIDLNLAVGAGIPELTDIVENTIVEIAIGDRVQRVDFYLSRGLFTVLNSSTGSNQIFTEFNLYAIPPDYFSTIYSILYDGTLPQRINDVIVVARENTILTTNLSEFGVIPCYTPIWGLSNEEVIELGFPYTGGYLNVSGLVTKESFSNVLGPQATDFDAMTDFFSTEFMITSYTNLQNFVTEMGYLNGLATPSGRISFDLDKIDSFAIKQEISYITEFSQTLTRNFEVKGFTCHIYPVLSDLLEKFNREFIILQLFGVLFIAPLIGMALSLTNYSANLLKRRQKRQISSMLQRGCSRKEVVFNLIIQVVELTITAILIAFIMGFLFTWLLSKSTGFLLFTAIASPPVMNLVILYVVIISGFVLSFIVNAMNIWDMSQITTQEAYTEHQYKKPFWEKSFLDFFLFAIGIALWLVVDLQLKGSSAYVFAITLGTAAPVLTILGGILIVARFYPKIIEKLSNLSWKMEKFEVIGLATKRSARRKGDTARSLVLLTMTFTLIFASIVTITSYQNFDEENAFYKIGSDILIRNVNSFNNEIKDQVEAIEGVQSSTYIRTTSQILTYGQLTYNYLIIGINQTEFAQVAFFKKNYLDTKDPTEFFSKIHDSNDVVIQKDQYSRFEPVDNQIIVHYNKYPLGIQNKTLDVVGVYNLMPRFYLEKSDPTSSTFKFSIIGTFENLNSLASSSYNINGDLLVKVNPNYKIDEVANRLEIALDRSVENSEDLKDTFEGSLRNTMLYGSLNATFISALIITVAAIILMILIQAIEKEREVVTLKILGMSPRQLFGMFLTESLSMVIFGAIIGGALGTFAALMFNNVLTFEVNIPPNNLSFPPMELSLAIILLIITAIGSAALTSWIVFRKDTIKAIKQI